MQKPAILGGRPIIESHPSAPLRWPILGKAEARAIQRVLSHGDLSCHPVTRDLERSYRRRTGRRLALAHCNGTAALTASFFALNLQPGDEVLVPSATFWASVVPMLWFGLLPVFCESDPERLGLDPADVESKITGRTRAMVVVHLFGMPSRMTPLLEIARRHGLKIVEDASHAHGAMWRGRPCGSLGDVSVFSLQTSKLAPAGEGGMLLTDDEEIFRRSVCMGDMMRILELEGPERRFAGTTFGMKTRMAPLSAAIAECQLRQLDRRNLRRRENLEYLSSKLERLGFETYLPPPHVERTYFEFVIRPRAEKVDLPAALLVRALSAEGCQASHARYPLLHQQPLFTEGAFQNIARVDRPEGLPQYLPDALPRTQRLRSELVTLPAFPRADRRLLDRYVDAFEKVLGAADQIRKNHQEPILTGAER
ncbi:MAG TPA: DegT/DnrJ/EryC1/StrS family aminotransferase [Acidobacteriota bacterium]|nr:DegT/DnrJ/EryC1/StrS family aminotransferase [Acidobacteriota bacterium]